MSRVTCYDLVRATTTLMLVSGCFAAVTVAERHSDRTTNLQKVSNAMADQLADESESVRKGAAAEILKSRQAEIQRLITIVERGVANDRKAAVRDGMLLLGQLRAVEAVPMLVQRLTFQVPYLATRPQPIEDLCPAVQALIDIGSPSLRPVLERIEGEDGDILQRAGAAVFRGVLGETWAMTQLESRIRSGATGVRTDRLRQVVEKLAQLPK